MELKKKSDEQKLVPHWKVSKILKLDPIDEYSLILDLIRYFQDEYASASMAGYTQVKTGL